MFLEKKCRVHPKVENPVELADLKTRKELLCMMKLVIRHVSQDAVCVVLLVVGSLCKEDVKTAAFPDQEKETCSRSAGGAKQNFPARDVELTPRGSLVS